MKTTITVGHWWRAYDDCVDNPKVQLLPDALFRAWFNLLCLTSANGGTLPTAKHIAFRLRMTEARVKQVVRDLIAAKLIEIEGDTLVPHDWNSRQFKSDTEDPTGAERARRYRDRKRDGNGSVTRDGHGGARDDERDEHRDDERDDSVTVTAASRPSEADTDTEAETETDKKTNKKAEIIINTISGAARETTTTTTPEAILLVVEIAKIAGLPDQKSWPPGWSRASLRAQVWIEAGWPREVVLAACRAAMARKRDGQPPESINYFEKEVARAVAQHAKPVPKVSGGETGGGIRRTTPEPPLPQVDPETRERQVKDYQERVRSRLATPVRPPERMADDKHGERVAADLAARKARQEEGQR